MLLRPYWIVQKPHPLSLATFFNENEVELVFNENILFGKGKRDLITSPTIYKLETNVLKNKLIIKWNDSNLAETPHTNFIFQIQLLI